MTEVWEEHASFREGYSTSDNDFISHALIQIHLVKKRKLYVAFIDFRKDFDSVDRSKMWAILQKHVINGKMMRTLKSIYNSI